MCIFCACLLGLGWGGWLVECPLLWPETGPWEPLPEGSGSTVPLALLQPGVEAGVCEPWPEEARGTPRSPILSPLGQQGLDIVLNSSVLERKERQPRRRCIEMEEDWEEDVEEDKKKRQTLKSCLSLWKGDFYHGLALISFLFETNNPWSVPICIRTILFSLWK